MCEKIYFHELYCYINATDKMKKHKLYSPNSCFDLTQLNDRWLGFQIEAFIRDRGMKLTPLSIRADLFPFNQLCKFINEECPDLDSFTDITQDDIIRKAKAWLLKSRKNLTQRRKRTTTGKTEIKDAELILYIRKIYKYLYPYETCFNYDSDKWFLKDIPLNVKDNPVKNTKSISFEKIYQPKIRETIKSVIYMHLSEKALGTVCAELTAINRFCKYLMERYPEVESFGDIDRELLEQYLIYIHTEASPRKSYRNDLSHLKGIFVTAGKVLENKELENIFYRDDIGSDPARLYKVYSDSEILRLNRVIVEGDEQIARALFLHQLLGTRISETLTLKQDAVFRGANEKLFIRIKQVKKNKTYEKPVNEDTLRLFEKSCDYTKARYGSREYVFVTASDPDRPMQYARVQDQLMSMIQTNDLRDDHGKLFGVGTQIWRHCYGKKLTELQVDDVIIAKLMGHSGTGSLKHYRKIGDQMMADSTREVRCQLDSILKDIMEDWR